MHFFGINITHAILGNLNYKIIIMIIIIILYTCKKNIICHAYLFSLCQSVCIFVFGVKEALKGMLQQSFSL